MPLTNNEITLFAVVREANPGMGDWTQYGEQDNLPTLQVTDDPPVGAWRWSITEGPNGFTGGAVGFTLNTTDPAGRTAELGWSGIVPLDWRNGVQGDIQVTLTDDDGAGSTTIGPFIVNVHLRSLQWIDFTVIESQTEAGANPVCMEPPGGGSWTWTPDAPIVYNISFDPEGRIDVAYAGDWSSVDDNFAITLHDGSPRPSSIFDGSRPGAGASSPSLKLRKLVGDGYTIIEGQTQGGDAITGDPAELYFFDPDTSATPGVTLTLNGRGAVTGWTSGPDCLFDLNITDGGRPCSNFTNLHLNFRTMPPIAIPYFAGGANAVVNGEAGLTWNWMDFSHDLSLTTVDPDPTPTESSAGLPLSAPSKTPGEYGTATIDLQKGSAASPLRPWSRVQVPIYVRMWIWPKWFWGVYALPSGRARMRYQAALQADALFSAASEKLEWTLDLSGTPLDGVLQLATGETDTTDNVLQTPIDGGGASFLPDTSGSYSVQMTLTKRRNSDDALLAESEPVALTLDLAATHSNVNVTILLDRSGSMSAQERWNAACSGAGTFAVLMTELESGAGSHKLGLYWFNSNYGGTDPTGTFVNGDGESYVLDGGAALADAMNVGTVCAGYSPQGATALGQGLILCRDELVDAAGDAERVILLLSDGMENQSPLTTAVFPSDSGPGTWGSPNVRIYPLALMTGSSWVDRLKSIVSATGGLPAVDVKHIEGWTVDTPDKINTWFIWMFKALFGFNQLVAPPDPSLSKNQKGEHPVSVHSGQTRLVFYCTHHEPKPADWSFAVRLPGGAATITKANAGIANGVRYYETRMSKMIVVDFPVPLDGCEHVWIGEWTLVVTRLGSGTGHYGVGALAQQAMGLDVDVLSSERPVPGEIASIRARITDRDGKPCTNATVTAAVTAPGGWLGDYLTQKIRRKPELYRLVTKSKSMANRDVERPEDKLLQRLIGDSRRKRGETRRLKLKHLGKGVYGGEFTTRLPGEYTIDLKCTGYRSANAKEISTRKGLVKAAAKTAVSERLAGLKRKEKTAYKKRAELLFSQAIAKKQRFQIESRHSLGVSFVPDAGKSTRYGFVDEDASICLYIEPRDKRGQYLGPGFADQIVFGTPASFRTKWKARDMLDGTYEVEIPMTLTGGQLRISDTVLIGNRMHLVHPEGSAKVRPVKPELPLDGFSVQVLGVTMPLEVFAIAGNRKTREAHLFSCRHVAEISDEHFEWFENLKDVQRAGFDTCEICMPLVCNTATMEAHKPLCSHVGRIRVSNRKEIHSWSVAKRQGYDGCKYCLPEKHTR